MITRIIAIITALLSVLLVDTPLALKTDSAVDHKYIIIQDTDKENMVELIQNLYGKNNPENEIMYAMGVCGPMLLTSSPEVIRADAENAFELALKYDVPVWFQIDDVNNHNYAYAGEWYVTCEKWYENPENCEKLGFGDDADKAPYWFNWGKWMKTPAMPCFNSESFVAFIKNQLNEGFLPVLKKYLPILKEQNKEYLFAGVSVGWETRIPDYSDIERDIVDQLGNKITEDECRMTGYRALENLGYTEESLRAEAKEKHMSYEMLRYELICQVCHDYSEMIAKEIYDCGVEKTKIFTHYVIDDAIIHNKTNISYNSLYVKTAVNDYSTPGFTNNYNVSFRRLGILKAKIAAADPEETNYGIVEGYAMGLNNSEEETLEYFDKLFNSGAIVVAVYGIHDASGSIFEVPKTSDAPFSTAIKELINR